MRRKNLDISDRQMTRHAQSITNDSRRHMTSRMKILSAAATAAVLLATVTVARTVHSHATSVLQATHEGTIGATRSQTAPSRRHGNIACAAPSEAECEKLETWFPE